LLIGQAYQAQSAGSSALLAKRRHRKPTPWRATPMSRGGCLGTFRLYISAMLRSIPAKTQSVVLVCRKCSKKLGGGFGKKGKTALADALRDLGNGKKGRKSDLLVIETDCLKLCPKMAVVAINPANPDEWLLVPARSDVSLAASRLGVTR
jgi:predicted metal-binding protein